MLEHFGHKHTGVLPEDVIQWLLLGVSFPITFVFLNFYRSVSGSQQLSLFDPSSNLFYFQTTCTLELALHLESKVISLKQDALKLINIALVGTAQTKFCLSLSSLLVTPRARNQSTGQLNWRSWKESLISMMRP